MIDVHLLIDEFVFLYRNFIFLFHFKQIFWNMLNWIL